MLLVSVDIYSKPEFNTYKYNF